MGFKKLAMAFTAAVVLFAGPVWAQEKIALSPDDSFEVLAHKMVDFATGVIFYGQCQDQEIGRKELKAIGHWLERNQPAYKAQALLKIFGEVSMTHVKDIDEIRTNRGQEAVSELCKRYQPLYERLLIPQSLHTDSIGRSPADKSK